jgi:hypothetical protein
MVISDFTLRIHKALDASLAPLATRVLDLWIRLSIVRLAIVLLGLNVWIDNFVQRPLGF